MNPSAEVPPSPSPTPEVAPRCPSSTSAPSTAAEGGWSVLRLFPDLARRNHPHTAACLPPKITSLPPKITSSHSGAAVVFGNHFRSCGSAKCPCGRCWRGCDLRRQVTLRSGKLWLRLRGPGGSCSRGNRCFVTESEELSPFFQILGSRELRSALGCHSLGCRTDFIVRKTSVC